jgi:hypothetical protein
MSTTNDTGVHFCRPDLTLVDRTSKKAAFTDTAVPLAHSLQTTITGKQLKYQDLAFETQQQWRLKNVIVNPLVLSAVGSSLTCVTKA